MKVVKFRKMRHLLWQRSITELKASVERMFDVIMGADLYIVINLFGSLEN